ncbi:MAG TPA: hypothetical protein VKR53_16565 [Puia sp.]|nr:hypothetical protein [Puia sp.]
MIPWQKTVQEEVQIQAIKKNGSGDGMYHHIIEHSMLRPAWNKYILTGTR